MTEYEQLQEQKKKIIAEQWRGLTIRVSLSEILSLVGIPEGVRIQPVRFDPEQRCLLIDLLSTAPFVLSGNPDCQAMKVSAGEDLPHISLEMCLINSVLVENT